MSGATADPADDDGSDAANAAPDRAVLFDATGTLIEARESVGEVYRRVALEHGVDLPAWRLEDAFHRILRHAPTRGVEGATPEARREAEVAWWFERIRQTFQATDSTVRFADFPAFAGALFDAYRGANAWHLRPGIPELLATLDGDGVPMAVVSNFDHRLPDLLQALEIDRFFESVVLPADLGAAKPDPALFAAVGEALDRPLAHLVYVGDDPAERLDAIAALGLRTIDVRAFENEADLAGAVRAALR